METPNDSQDIDADDSPPVEPVAAGGPAGAEPLLGAGGGVERLGAVGGVQWRVVDL